MSFQPPIAKGIVSAFDEMLKDTHKLSLISHIRQTHEEPPAQFKEIFQGYDKIMENSTDDDCFEMIRLLRKVSENEYFVAKAEKETAVEDFYQNLKKFRDLVEQKIALPLQEWKDIKRDLINFSVIHKNLQQELDDVRNSVEKARHLRKKEMSEEEAKEKIARKMHLASEDFTSLQPFFIIANAEEHMKRISDLKEKKLQSLKCQLKSAEQSFQRTIKANKKEIQTIIEESIDTKSFIEWIEEKNYNALKALEVKMKEEWDEFCNEMEKSRSLSNIYAEKHEIYLNIKRQEDEEERLGKQEGAATLLQAHWRGYMTRRRLRGETFF